MFQQFTPSLVPVPRVSARARPTGLLAGTVVRTADGELPVEYLLAGDRVATVSNGLVELRGTSLVEAQDIDVVCFAPSALGRLRDLVVPMHQQVLVHDWRAQILHGRDSMLTPAASMVDDLHVTRERREAVRLIRLHFDDPQVLWADGLKVASAPTPAPGILATGLLH
ncbi:Hint domain-containing protein [Pararhodobacter oceanensis]|nr:Hint domain-containing protein [Pararhodobacter oceanensis]